MTKVTLWISRKLSTTFKTSRFYFPVYELSRRFCCGFLDFQRSSYYLFICQCVKQQMAKDTSCHEKSLLLVQLTHDIFAILKIWLWDKYTPSYYWPVSKMVVKATDSYETILLQYKRNTLWTQFIKIITFFRCQHCNLSFVKRNNFWK